MSAAAMPAPSPQRSCYCDSWTRGPGRISISPAPVWARRKTTPTRAGPRASACGSWIGWWRTTTRSEGKLAVTEILFYHLQNQPLERVLPTLLEKSLERGWRVVVQAASEERVEALDAHLWTFRDDSFLPHSTWRDADAREQPILLTINDDNPNGAGVRFLLDGAPVPSDAGAYERIVLLFDGADTDAVDAARARWSEAKANGFDITYWQPDERGRWQR